MKEKKNITKNQNNFIPRELCPVSQRSGRFAFTLIELLVVVLIIGILTAIAIPQYQKAVIKSKLASLQILVEEIYQATEIYYMVNNTCPNSFAELDIDIPTPLSTEDIQDKKSFVAYYPWGTYNIVYEQTQQFVACINSSFHIGYFHYSPTTTQYKVVRACSACDNDPQAISLCKTETHKIEPYYKKSEEGTFSYSY